VIKICDEGKFDPDILNDILELDISEEKGWNDYGITNRMYKRKI
jgi:hypothetical protein